MSVEVVRKYIYVKWISICRMIMQNYEFEALRKIIRMHGSM